MIRVLIVDDQTLVRQGVRTLLSLAETPFETDEAADGIEALECVDAGRTLVQPALTERIVQGLTNPELAHRDTDSSWTGSEARPLEALTERETEILRLLVAGWNKKEIALGMDVMEGTVKNHVSRILSKLGVRDRTRAVLRAIELGFVRA